MQAKKSAAHLSHFDTFECLTCSTTIMEQPTTPPGGSTPRGDSH